MLKCGHRTRGFDPPLAAGCKNPPLGQAKCVMVDFCLELFKKTREPEEGGPLYTVQRHSKSIQIVYNCL